MTIIFKKSLSSFERLPDQPFVWILSSLRDFSGIGLRDGDFGIWTPTGSQPILLRYKAACTFAGGGTVQAWMTPIAYAGTPVMQAYTDGTEPNSGPGGLTSKGWTITNDAGGSVTATGGFQRISITSTPQAAARLIAMLSGLTASTRVECLCETRANNNPTSSLYWVMFLADGVNATTVGQTNTWGFGFVNGVSAPLNTPFRNNASPSLPTLAQDPAVLLIRDEGSTVMASVQQNGLPLADYRRNINTNAGNFLLVYVYTEAGVTSTADFRGQFITY